MRIMLALIAISLAFTPLAAAGVETGNPIHFAGCTFTAVVGEDEWPGCTPFVTATTDDGATYYVYADYYGIGVWEETNGCAGLQTRFAPCEDGSFDTRVAGA